ncbi:MAG: sugar ABC transporter ATP-binding protein [Anaerolineae bacterium]|nr:sugar ABC transporter ATP-binding protein [Anaerolineae bacterium]
MTETPPLLRMENISKRFPGVLALDNVTFELQAGEVHVLLGENGAGKSTLVKALCGSQPMDSGRILIEGQDVGPLTPARAQDLGIGMVYQELSLVPYLSVAENIMINHMPRNRIGIVDWNGAYAAAKESLAALGVEHINPRMRVSRLNVAEQQLTEIVRVLSRRCKILLLDEPTSALSETETEKLFEIIRRLQAQGVGIIYISHRLHEVPMVGTRVTVMRDGKIAGTLPVADTDRETLVSLMIGRRLAEQYPKHDTPPGATILRVQDLSAPKSLHKLSFEVRRGEIIGIFGAMGAGQTELARALFGMLPDVTGTIEIDGVPVKLHRPADAVKHQIGFLPRDRRESLVPALPIPPNVTLVKTGSSPIYRLLNPSAERKLSGDYVRDLQIRPAILNRKVVYLSGGNQQKVVLARWMCTKAQLLIFDEPTRGIDVGAKAEVFALMNRLTEQGIGVIMISSEIPEILAMADRIFVIRDGQFVATYQRGEATQEQLLQDAS